MKRATHVRFSSPFGSPSARMERLQAERHCAEDDARWLQWQLLDMLNDEQRQHGPPKIIELPR